MKTQMFKTNGGIRVAASQVIGYHAENGSTIFIQLKNGETVSHTTDTPEGTRYALEVLDELNTVIDLPRK